MVRGACMACAGAWVVCAGYRVVRSSGSLRVLLGWPHRLCKGVGGSEESRRCAGDVLEARGWSRGLCGGAGDTEEARRFAEEAEEELLPRRKP